MKFHVRVSQNRLKIVFLSEGGALAAVVRSLSGNPRCNWIEGDTTSLDARLFAPRRVLSSDKRRGTREGRIWRERPPLLVALVRHGGGESNFIPNFTLTPLPRGGRSLSSDPCGKAEMPIQEASALMPRDSSDWMPKASMTSARLQQWEPTRRRVDAAWLYSPMFLRQDRGGYVTWRARRF